MRSIVVLPTYNERENIAAMLDALVSLGAALQIVVVDDNSPDGTAAIAEDRSRRHGRIHTVVRRDERGLGTAYACGFRHALDLGADAIVTMDCDFSHDPADVLRLLDRLARCDVAMGSRYVPGGGTRGWPIRRKLFSRAANAFARACLELEPQDCTSGFRAYRGPLLECLIGQSLQSRGYSIQVELLARAVRQFGAKAVEVPILFREREHGTSKIGWREAFAGCRAIMAVRRQLAHAAPQPVPAVSVGAGAPGGEDTGGRPEACGRDAGGAAGVPCRADLARAARAGTATGGGYPR